MNARATRGPQRGAGRRPNRFRVAGARRITSPPNLNPPTRPASTGCAVLVGGFTLALIGSIAGSLYAGGWLS